MLKDAFKAWCHLPTQRQVWSLAGPMMLSGVSVPLVTLVDTAVIGHLPNAQALSAVAVGGSMYVLLVGILAFLRMGTTGFSAQACGRADGHALRRILLQSLVLALVLALLVGLLAIPLSNALLVLINPSAEMDQLTRDFFHTRLWGLPGALASYALVGWLLGNQNARAPLAILLTTNLCNVGLSLWFVLALELGVKGAAWAAVLSETAGACIGLWLSRATLRRHSGRMPWPELGRWHLWQPLLSMNRDIFLRSLALQCVFLLVAIQGARLGELTVAANLLLLNGLLVTAYALDGIAHAIEALSGHAIGAANPTQLKRSLWVTGGWTLVLSLTFSSAFLFFGPAFLALQSNQPEVLLIAQQFLPYLALLPLSAAASYFLDGLLIGATCAREMRNAMLGALVIALPVGWYLQDLGNHGLWLALLLFMLIRSVLMAFYSRAVAQRQAWFMPPTTTCQKPRN